MCYEDTDTLINEILCRYVDSVETIVDPTILSIHVFMKVVFYFRIKFNDITTVDYSWLLIASMLCGRTIRNKFESSNKSTFNIVM